MSSPSPTIIRRKKKIDKTKKKRKDEEDDMEEYSFDSTSGDSLSTSRDDGLSVDSEGVRLFLFNSLSITFYISIFR